MKRNRDRFLLNCQGLAFGIADDQESFGKESRWVVWGSLLTIREDEVWGGVGNLYIQKGLKASSRSGMGKLRLAKATFVCFSIKFLYFGICGFLSVTPAAALSQNSDHDSKKVARSYFRGTRVKSFMGGR